MYQTSLAHQRPRGLTAEELQDISALRRKGYPDPYIANVLGRPLMLVRAAVTLAEEDAPAPPPAPAPVSRVVPMTRMGREAARIAALYGVTLDDLIGPSLARRFTEPRLHCYAALIDQGYTLNQIARFMGGRSHTSICKGAAKWRKGEVGA